MDKYQPGVYIQTRPTLSLHTSNSYARQHSVCVSIGSHVAVVKVDPWTDCVSCGFNHSKK